MFALAKIKPTSLGFLLAAQSAFAVSLPPRVQQQVVNFQDRIQRLPQRRALEVQSFYNQPVVHGRVLLELRSQTISLLSPDLSRVTDFVLKDNRYQQSSERSADSGGLRPSFFAQDIQTQKQFRHAQGWMSFASNDRRVLHYSESKSSQPLWSINLPFDPSAASQDSEQRALWLWASLPARLFVIPASLGVVSSFEWSPDSEIASVEECAPTTLVLTENTNKGLTRFVFFKNRVEPSAYTIFDFAMDARSDVSRVWPLDTHCEKFLVAGSFGLKRVLYPRGSL